MNSGLIRHGQISFDSNDMAFLQYSFFNYFLFNTYNYYSLTESPFRVPLIHIGKNTKNDTNGDYYHDKSLFYAL